MPNSNSHIRHQASRKSNNNSVTGRTLVSTPFVVVEYMTQAIVKLHSLPKSKVTQILKLSAIPDDFNTATMTGGVSKLDAMIAKDPDAKEAWCKQVSDDLLQGTRTYVNPTQVLAYVIASQLQHNLDIKDTGLITLDKTVTFYRKDLRGKVLQFVNGKDTRHCQLLLGMSDSDWSIQGYLLLTPDSKEWNQYSKTVSHHTYSAFSYDMETSKVTLLTRKLKVKATGELLKAAFNVREQSLVSVN